MKWLILQALIAWNWVTNLYTWIFSVSRRSVKGIMDAQKDELYVFLDAGLPLVTRTPVPDAICIYTPSKKRFTFTGSNDQKNHRFNVLSARLVGPHTEDLTEFFAEAAWTGSEVGPTASQAVIAAMLERGVPLTATTLATHHLEVEDEMGTPHKVTEFSQVGLVPG